ncbi:hypothetical protein BGX31_007827 [Mortierella sp. GBA43]|nr:hypothetical protein BGX31_007827 [Mortierella sp. GBA43]
MTGEVVKSYSSLQECFAAAVRKLHDLVGLDTAMDGSFTPAHCSTVGLEGEYNGDARHFRIDYDSSKGFHINFLVLGQKYAYTVSAGDILAENMYSSFLERFEAQPNAESLKDFIFGIANGTVQYAPTPASYGPY